MANFSCSFNILWCIGAGEDLDYRCVFCPHAEKSPILHTVSERNNIDTYDIE